MTLEEFSKAAEDRHSGAPFNGMLRRGWRRVRRGFGWYWEHERNSRATLADDMKAEWRAQGLDTTPR